MYNNVVEILAFRIMILLPLFIIL